jgi:hypothetical protein
MRRDLASHIDHMDLAVLTTLVCGDQLSDGFRRGNVLFKEIESCGP